MAKSTFGSARSRRSAQYSLAQRSVTDLSTSSPPLVGKFIVFEGGGGSGKDTLINILKEKTAGRGDIVFTRDPGGTAMGEKIREVLLYSKPDEIHPHTELLLFLAARNQLTEEIIRPALLSGKTVVSNRYSLSTIAYQVYGRERLEDLDMVREASRIAVGGLVPDLCIFLDVPPKVGIGRARARKEKPHTFVAADIAFQERVYEGYKKHLAESAKKAVTIDTSGTIEEAWKKTEEALQLFL